jgi:uncharacterized protein (DUF885 family)
MRSLAMIALAATVVSGAASCRPPAGSSEAARTGGFAAWRDRWIDDFLERNPQRGVGLGVHRFDGRLPDVSTSALERERAWLHANLDVVDRFAQPGLSATAEAERAAIRNVLAAALFNLESLRSPWRNPLHYLRTLNLDAYVVREYAPPDVRARAIVAYAASARRLLADAEENLRGATIPRPWIELAAGMGNGAASFAENDVAPAFAALSDATLRKELEAALAAHAADLRRFVAFVESKRETAPAEFGIGGELYVKGLADVENLVIDVASLERIAAEDTARNLAAVAEAAAQLAPGRPVAEVVEAVRADRPSPDEVLDVARRQATEARAFLLTHPIVSIPSEHVAEVRTSPPFSRQNTASLSSPGPFEEKPLPSFYYITPPDPTWPPEQQRTYLHPRAHLAFTTVHELWPGHFLQHLYLNRNPSRVLKAFCSYTNVEGWAHYAEEMMWDAGFGGGDPKLRIGMLLAALMRDARFLAALGMHTRGMSVEEATKLFQEKAFMSLSTARQQAMRGTADPFYSSYTLGKLMIRKLHDDWKAKLARDGKSADYSLQSFHETFLGAGCQAIPIIRRAMVGGGPSL